MRRTATIFLLALIATFASAQQNNTIPFNGIIEDALGNPLKGAKVWVINNWYAKSNKKGRFGLTNVSATDTLHVKYKSSQYDIPLEGRKSIRVRISDQMSFNAREDEELANTGYGFVKRRELNIPSSGISGEILIRTGKTNILDALQGLVPGLSVTNGKAIIRGIGTLYGSTDPLFIVDNVEVSSLSYINVYEVDSVEVLKDGSIYGSKGGNGVIIVKTKTGLR